MHVCVIQDAMVSGFNSYGIFLGDFSVLFVKLFVGH